MVDPVISQKIDSLSRCVSRIEEKRPQNVNVLINDIDLQDIISINLERAIQQCVDIAMIKLSSVNSPLPSTMSEAFDELADKKIITPSTAIRMKKAVGFRNIAVHEYRKVDWNIVWYIITDNLIDFRKFAAEILHSN